MEILARSRALWDRLRLDLESDEILAQLLDRGSLEDWRALHELLRREGGAARRLRERVHGILYQVPVGRPYFWLAGLSTLGQPINWRKEPKTDPGEAA
jgi:hypothetical protein